MPLHELAAKVVVEYVFQSSSAVNDIVDSVLTQQEKEDIAATRTDTRKKISMQVSWLHKSFKYNGKSRSHNFHMNHLYSSRRNPHP